MARGKLKEGLLTRKVNLLVYAKDITTIDTSFPDIGHNAVVRELIHGYAEDLRARVEKRPILHPFQHTYTAKRLLCLPMEQSTGIIHD